MITVINVPIYFKVLSLAVLVEIIINNIANAIILELLITLELLKNDIGYIIMLNVKYM